MQSKKNEENISDDNAVFERFGLQRHGSFSRGRQNAADAAGRLNACILEQARSKAANPETFSNVDLAANQVANYCIRSLDMLDSGLYRQSVVNATSIINSYNQ